MWDFFCTFAPDFDNNRTSYIVHRQNVHHLALVKARVVAREYSAKLNY